jgi:hypothetical protein
VCIKCGCGYVNGAGKYDMQAEVFDDSTPVRSGAVVVQPFPRDKRGDYR